MSYDPMNRIRERLVGAKEKFEEAQADHAEAFKTNPAYATEWKLAAVLEAQAIYEVAESYGTDDEAIDLFVNESKRRLQFVRGESKSTSQAKNLAEDIRTATQLQFLADIFEAQEELKIAAGIAQGMTPAEAEESK